VPIAREIEGQTKREVKLGSVYATLERLQEKGFVVSELGEPASLPTQRFQEPASNYATRHNHRWSGDLVQLVRTLPGH
jgi:hypothetical protein